MAEPGIISIRDAVGDALAGAREHLRFIGAVSVFGAAALALVAALALAAPAAGIVTGLAGTFVRAVVYAAFVGAALAGAAGVRQRLGGDSWRIWVAMAVIGFFMFIVMTVLSIPGLIVLFAGPAADYVGELQAAGADQGAVMQVMLRFAEQNPLAVILFVVFYLVVWLLLTSRLYLAAPASAGAGRILTFETWAWTKGAALKISAARVMLLGPAWVLVSALDALFGRLIGLDAFDPAAVVGAARAQPIQFLLYAFLSSVVSLAIYSSLEAWLSSTLYRRMRPSAAPLPGA